MEVLTGLRKTEEGRILINGVDASNKSPKEIRNLGIAHVPEDRLSTGLSTEATIWENLIMGLQHEEPYATRGGIYMNEKR